MWSSTSQQLLSRFQRVSASTAIYSAQLTGNNWIHCLGSFLRPVTMKRRSLDDLYACEDGGEGLQRASVLRDSPRFLSSSSSSSSVSKPFLGKNTNANKPPPRCRSHSQTTKADRKGGSRKSDSHRRKPGGSDTTRRNWNLVNNDDGASFQRRMPFSVMSYNCLSQTALNYHRELYRSIPDEKLEWEYRWQRLKWQLTISDADIICLQEVRNDHYRDFYRPLLEEKGYNASYKQRCGGKDDGCAFFYNEDKFNCVAKKELNLNLGRGVLNRDNVAILMMLKPKGRSIPPICVVTTHILFNMRRGDVKLAQLAYILAEADRLINDYREEGQQQQQLSRPVGGVIVTGDLNLTPFSPLYNFLQTGSLKYEGLKSSAVSMGARRPISKYGGKLLCPDLLESVGLTPECRFVGSATSGDDVTPPEAPSIAGHVDSVLSTTTLATETSEAPFPTSPLSSVSSPSLRRSGSADSRDLDSPVESQNPLDEPDPDGVSPLGTRTPPPPLVTPPISRPRLAPPRGSVRHPFHFRSAYFHRRRDERTGRMEDEVSTFHDNEMNTVDYIFYDHLHGPHLKFSHHKPLPTVTQAQIAGKMPNDLNGSDHFALCAEFVLYE